MSVYNRHQFRITGGLSQDALRRIRKIGTAHSPLCYDGDGETLMLSLACSDEERAQVQAIIDEETRKS